MTKGKGIGIFVTVIAVAIVVGIASLPDEVLLESPQLDAFENLLPEMIPIEVQCGVVRGLEVQAHQAQQRVQETLGLAKRQPENDPQRQRGQDR